MHTALLVHGGGLHRLALLPARVVERCGRMVRADGRECPIGDAAPDVFQVLGIMPQRRRADVLGPLDVALPAAERCADEVEVVRARFGVDGEEAGLGGRDVLHGTGRRHVHEQDGRVGDFGEGDGAVGGLGLGDLGPGHGVEESAGVACLGEALGDGRDHVAVFGVDHGGDAERARTHHHVEEVCVAELHGLVGHVELHGRDAFVRDELGEFLFQDGCCWVGENYVETVVAISVSCGLFVVGRQGRIERIFITFLACKGDDSCIPAC